MNFRFSVVVFGSIKSYYLKEIQVLTLNRMHDCTMLVCHFGSECKTVSRWCDLTVSSCANRFPARVCLQAHCVKTEPGEPCENKPNLRRRMGSFVAKQEPGQYRTLQRSRCTQRAKISFLSEEPFFISIFFMVSVSLLLQRKKSPFQLNRNQLKSRNQSLKWTSLNPGTRNSSHPFLRVQ